MAETNCASETASLPRNPSASSSAVLPKQGKSGAFRQDRSVARKQSTQSKTSASSLVSRQSTPKRWCPVRHYKHQVSLIRQLIPAACRWETFLGALGTGIVGVRPATRKNSLAKARLQLKNGRKWLRPKQDKVRQTCIINSAVTDPKFRDHSVEAKSSAGKVVLFLNSANAQLQTVWRGRNAAGFSSTLDIPKRTLTWESQRSDVGGKMIQAICEQVQKGAEVVVAVRAAPGMPYGVLGVTKDFHLHSVAHFLVRDGDHLIIEQGSHRVHRAVTAQCLDPGLKAGVGLFAQRYPLPRTFGMPKYCRSCCWLPATAQLNLEFIDEEIATAFVIGSVKPEKTLKQEHALIKTEPPRKRLMWKQPAGACPNWKNAPSPSQLEKRQDSTAHSTQESKSDDPPLSKEEPLVKEEELMDVKDEDLSEKDEDLSDPVQSPVADPASDEAETVALVWRPKITSTLNSTFVRDDESSAGIGGVVVAPTPLGRARWRRLLRRSASAGCDSDISDQVLHAEQASCDSTAQPST